METFLAIARNSILVLIGLTALAGAFIFVGKWVIDRSEDPDAERH